MTTRDDHDPNDWLTAEEANLARQAGAQFSVGLYRAALGSDPREFFRAGRELIDRLIADLDRPVGERKGLRLIRGGGA